MATIALGSKEHYDLMSAFERDFRTQNVFCGRLDKEAKELWRQGNIYQDGTVNAMFAAYRMGYVFGKWQSE